MKRLLTLCLSVLMLVSVLCVTASAADSLPFTDIPEDFPFRAQIQYVYDAGLMNGTGPTTFSPESPYTRAMFVTMLGRMEGVDVTQYPGSQFKDVAVGNWAAPYINWAAQKNIVNGVGDGKFAPDTVITEEQYCTIVCRYMDSKGYDFPGTPIWTPEILDMDEVSTWAKSSVVNMVYYNLVWLTDDFAFLPQEPMNRAVIACYFADLHWMFNTGECPVGFYDPATETTLEGQDIMTILRSAASYLGNWFYFNSYCDSGDTISAPNTYVHDPGGYWTFERVANPYISSVRELTDQGYRYYVADLVPMLAENKQILERDNSLYLSKPDGLGGFVIDRAHIDAMIEDASYILTISYYIGDELSYTQEVRMFYDGNRWVLSDPVDVCLMYADMDIAWG